MTDETTADGARAIHLGVTRAGSAVGDDQAAGQAVTLPLEKVLVGRAFLTGKSGAGKSNTASVVIERLLDAGRPLAIVDVEGEYYGLKEQYELLHAGADDAADIQVGPEHAEKLAQLAIGRSVPVILDLSGFLDEQVADDLVGAFARALFATAKQEREPFPLFLEECHEYIPQQGTAGETGEAVIRIAKRGRKHGLGLVGISQRPASVDKDYITQCNWLVWHRLTWDNDTSVVRRVLGSDYADAVQDLGDGEAFLVADWADAVRRVQIDRKETFDAGAAPGLEDADRPDLKSVSENLVDELAAISEQAQQRRDELDRLRAENERLRGEIDALEDELADTKDIRGIMADMVGSVAGGGADDQEQITVEIDGSELLVPEVLHAEVMEVRDRAREAEQRIDDLTAERDRHRKAAEHLAALFEEQVTPEGYEDVRAFVEEFGELVERHGSVLHLDADEETARLRERAREAEARVETLERQLADAEPAVGDDAGSGTGLLDADLTALLQHEAIQTAIDTAIERGTRADEHYRTALSVLASAEGTHKTASEVAGPLKSSERTVRDVLKDLHTAGVVDRTSKGRGHAYALDRALLEERIEVAERQAAISTSE
jgi:hypothetical protein